MKFGFKEFQGKEWRAQALCGTAQVGREMFGRIDCAFRHTSTSERYMRRFARSLALGLCLCSLGLGVDAAQLYKEARQAELAGKFEKAYILYSQAAVLDPGNRTYWLRSQAVRTRAALEAIPAGGSLPSQFASEPPATASSQPLRKLEQPTDKELAEARKPQSPVELKASAERKDFDLSGDGRSLFEKVGQAFGLDCVFDSDYQAGRPARFRMDSADYREALHALELVTNSFIVPLTGKLFLVANDTPQKRRDVEPWMSVAIDIPQSTSVQELTQLATAVQQTLALEKVSFDSRTNTVLLRGPMSKVVPAQALFQDLMRHRAEVVLDLDIYEVDRNDMLTYGAYLPYLFPFTAFNSVGNTVMTLADLARWGPGGTIFAVSIGNAQLLANFSKANSHSLTHVELRSLDGQAVSFHAGDRYPVLTAGYYGQATLSGASLNGGYPSTASPTTTNPTGSLLQTTVDATLAAPSAVFMADFDNDGILDFASTSSSSNQVAVFPGRRNGTFGNSTSYSTGQNPSALLVADVNRDGILDLVTADADSNQVSVLLGNGNGTFQSATAFPVGTKPSGLATADFNRDGFTDIAVANADSNNVTLLLGNGDGTFQQPLTIGAGTSPRSLTAADFNGDGMPDLAVVNFSSNDLWVLLGNGDGTFQEAAKYATGNAPRSVIADFINNDSFRDLVVANSASNTVSVFLGDGSGTFAAGQQFPTGSGPVSAVTADFNNDGLKDIAVANQAGGTVSLLLGEGTGTFQVPIDFTIGLGTQPVSIDHGDINLDGYQDLLVANFGAGYFSVLIGNPYGGFQDSSGNPIPSTGGQRYAPPPSFTFEDLGLVIKATPHVHAAGELGLELEAEIKLLTGNFVNGVPEIAQRKVQSQVQLRAGEAAMVAGLMSTQDARTLMGTAGLSTLPAVGPLFRQNTKNRSDSQVLIVIKPRILSLPPSESPTRTVWVGSESRPITPM